MNAVSHEYAGHRIFVPALDADWEALIRLRGTGDVFEQIDHYQRMWCEWFKLQHPSKQLTFQEVTEAFHQEHATLDVARCGVYVHFPWSRRIVHIVHEEAFVAVRTNRNQNKITASEQAELSGKRVGIVGLSVGAAVATTMAMERIAGTIVLADFDTLDLSNLNRLQGGIADIGVNKAMLAARRIAEQDPFIRVAIYPDGITMQNLNTFLNHGGQPLDLVMEECDHLPTKLAVREASRTAGIPVMMESSDRGMLDVERFDLEPTRPLLHGLIPEPLTDLEKLTGEERMKFISAIINYPATSQRLKDSFAQIGKTLSTWPQLASAVTLGGAVCTDVARRILLGQAITSGRYYIDLEQLVVQQDAILVN